MEKHDSTLTTTPGNATPLGPTIQEDGVNFALFSKHATRVTLHLFSTETAAPIAHLVLDPKVNRTGDVWHICVQNLPRPIDYAYSLDGPYIPKKGLLFNPSHHIVDPYAKSLNSSIHWGEAKNFHDLRGRILPHIPFEWGEDLPPHIPAEDLIIYEMHVRSFTIDTSSKVAAPGTFSGLIEKIPYLKELGINAIELLPIFEFNETENVRKNPKTGKRLFNYWGYSPVHFFHPTARYSSSSDPGAPILEFKQMVKELHKNKIEVLLDVVFNHTGENGEKGPYYSFRGIDNPIFYMLKNDGHYLDFTGCGNTFNCNHPVAMEFIIQALRYWVSEMHVDGFRFDLASIFCRDEKGHVLSDPPIVKAIAQDSVLAKVKLIAEPWDAAGLYQVGSFPSYGRWAEWNGKYRDVVRRFIKGSDGQAGLFASAFCGSADFYGYSRCPTHSINFVTAHDGFSLRDLVSYQSKHNEENGEHNRDGMDANDSWNCGHEGPTEDEAIHHLRLRQMKNFLFTLFTSIGTPMLLMGDEYGHTRHGNNNPYCQDDEKNWFLWHELQNNDELFQFCKKMIQFRQSTNYFRRTKFLDEQEIEWHGQEPLKANWGPDSRLVACTLKDNQGQKDLYIAWNAYFIDKELHLPPANGKKWYRIIDTGLATPQDCSLEGALLDSDRYLLKSHAALLLQMR